jgi:F420-non-reducing hydrogenase small subunit
MSDEQDLYGIVFEPGTFVFRQGDPGDTMYLVQSGAIEYSYKQGDLETVLDILEKGDFVGEKAFFGQSRRPGTAKVIRRSRLLPLTRVSLLERIRHDPGVALHLLKGVVLRSQLAARQVQQAIESDEVLRRALAQRNEERLRSTEITAPKRVEPVPEQEAGVPGDVSMLELAEIWGVEGEAIDFDPGQRIFLKGDRGDAMYIVLSGSVEIRSSIFDYQMHPGEFFGETAMFTDQPQPGSATAVGHTRVMPIGRQAFVEKIQERPELALFCLQALSVRIQRLSAGMGSLMESTDAARQDWRPLLGKQERIKLAMVSLSTCAGCSAVFLDQEGLDRVLEVADLVYCPMLVDQDHIPEADVALIEGVVRLQEDVEVLREVRLKSQVVIAWGTCACYGGIPAHANRYELEDLIQETYGQTYDAYAYYLSGAGGIEQATYQEEGIALLRKAYKLDDFCRVDYYVSGCPPIPELLLQIHAELTGQSLKGAKPIVCAECSRRPAKRAVTSLGAFPREDKEGTCFHSLGVLCMGFFTKGGCGAVCTRNGLPCWGCRGPAKTTVKSMADGNSYEEVVISRLVRRCGMEANELKPAVKCLRRQGHGLFDFEQHFLRSLSRTR